MRILPSRSITAATTVVIYEVLSCAARFRADMTDYALSAIPIVVGAALRLSSEFPE